MLTYSYEDLPIMICWLSKVYQWIFYILWDFLARARHIVVHRDFILSGQPRNAQCYVVF